ncbi:hypothetical protein [Neomoorella mulderi]|uniref:hypothetical protein n=1 Tax=Neomoorella mulderi TaxID=202604 RepID=UPI0012907973|nr:hypothetical protein [Moorella mulderi]
MVELETLRETLREAQEEGRPVVDVVCRLKEMGILHECPHDVDESPVDRYDREWLGFVKHEPRYGKPKYGWLKVFVPVVKVNGGTVAWYSDITSPAKLLTKLIERYREKNSKVVEEVLPLVEKRTP